MRLLKLVLIAISAAALLLAFGRSAGHDETNGPSQGVRLVQDAPAPMEPRAPTEAERKAASDAIEAQLKAFKADDYKKAEKYQSAGLKQNFRSTDEFREMMKRGYPQFANYKSVRFGDARCDAKGDNVQINVTVVGHDNVTVRAVYLMVREEGQYRVSSVFLEERPKADPSEVV
jgi:hypothetical protein